MRRSAGDATVRPYVAGAVVLAVAMGIGRFAYTPALVVMRADVHLSVALAGLLASANLLGYLVGALLAMHPFARSRRLALVRWGAVAVVITTGLMALPAPVWLPARFVTGVASGVVFVLTVSLLLDRAVATGSRYGNALAFSGIGSGIALAGALVPQFSALGGSRATWLGLAAVSAALLAWALPSLPALPPERAAPPPLAPATTTLPAGRGMFAWVTAVYAVEGAVYVIPATFLVAMVADTPPIARYAAATWVLVGLIAAPSTLAWAAATRRWGLPRAYVAACVAQALTMLVPSVAGGTVGIIVVGAGLGATFVGIGSLGTALARALRPRNGNAAIGLVTAMYGIGQVVGPLVATHIALSTGSYRNALPVAAAALLMVTCAFVVRLRWRVAAGEPSVGP